MYRITYDNIDDLREKLNKIKNRDQELNIECVEENSFKVDITTIGRSDRTELIYRDGSIGRYTHYTKFPSGEEYKDNETIYHMGGREYHAMWNSDPKGPQWDGEFKNGIRHGKLRWWWGADTVQKESIWSDGEFIRSNDYQGGGHSIEYGRADEFFEALRRAQIFNEDVEFKNSEPGPRRKLIGFVINDIWHYMCVSHFNNILKPLKVKIKDV